MIRPARTPAPDEDDFELDVDLGGVAPGAPVPASVPAVELVALGRVFGSEPPVVALRDVDLTLPRGTSLAILGPSGSGKSTLLNLLGCLDRQTSGTYLLDGIDVGALGDDERAALRAERIGFVFQSFNLLGAPPVVENVMLAEVYRGGPRDGRAKRALDALELVGMSHRASFLPTRAVRRRAAARRRSPGRCWATRRCCSATSRRATSTRPTPTRSSRSSTSCATPG